MSTISLIKRFELVCNNRWLQLQGANHTQDCMRSLLDAKDYCVELEGSHPEQLIDAIRFAAKPLDAFSSKQICYHERTFYCIVIRVLVLHIILDIGEEYEDMIRAVAMDNFCFEIIWALREIPSLYTAKGNS